MKNEIISVSELNQRARKLLEGEFPAVWVLGEISNLARPSSGHIYFSLKDSQAQVRCACFRPYSLRLSGNLQNGQQVQVQAKVSLYPDRGDYQLLVTEITEAGAGLLRQAYEQLVRKLAGLGMFQEKWKKPLPAWPTEIAVITSPTGAAIRDILSVLQRRAPHILVTIYPTKVQGTEAAAEMITAVQQVNLGKTAEVIILARGGGSLEDLWPFNEEKLAQAIFDSVIPIVSGVGHETDLTIADLVADLRAPTPSVAAEMVSPNLTALLDRFKSFELFLTKRMQQLLQTKAQHLDWASQRLRHPMQAIALQKQALARVLSQLNNAWLKMLQYKQLQYRQALRTLEALNPLATLTRGYAIVFHEGSQRVVRSVQELKNKDKLRIQLHDGEIHCLVTEDSKITTSSKKISEPM